MTHHRPRTDHDALAASLRTWALAFVGWLAEAIGAHTLTRSMRRWVHAKLALAEKGAAALLSLAALRLLPDPPAICPRRAARPLAAPRGFARRRICTHDLRSVLRFLFPRERDLLRRAARLARVLRTLGAATRKVARRVARLLPTTRLCAVRPPPAPCAPCAAADPPLAPDTS
jgi:hypothetical protein